MRDEPTVDDLLEAARESLLEHVLPRMPDNARLEVLMIANALAIARRVSAAGAAPLCSELRDLEAVYGLAPNTDLHGSDPDAKLHELNVQLARDIRCGKFDRPHAGHETVASLLWNVTLDKLRECRPKMLRTEGIE